ncbi:MAG: hypothetical protein A2W25_05300 [candidate division Zixibacteria bacterium RBG_16_53_22]|nr:MAG: hypothetical protein A2W25_05300 [candidate division Zixibacteria bacterium RBG_16_53_22]
MLIQIKPGPLSKAIAQQSAEWLEAVYPNVFDALLQELDSGKSILDIKQILRRTLGPDLREALAARILQASEHLISERVNAR